MNDCKNNINPFITIWYSGYELFCDREKEVKMLLSNAQNEVNTTLISVRRMGKTGLIYLKRYLEFYQQTIRKQSDEWGEWGWGFLGLLSCYWGSFVIKLGGNEVCCIDNS